MQYSPPPGPQPGPMYAPPPYSVVPGQPYVPRRSGKATAAMWLGIASIFPGSIMNWVGIVVGILGIIFSAIALSELRDLADHESDTGVMQARKRAMIGIVCSIIGIILSTIFLIYILQHYDVRSFTLSPK
jgi:uncharacterized membrane protein